MPPAARTKKTGRPRGRNKQAKNLSLDTSLVAAFDKIAFNEGMSFSGYVERLLRDKLKTLKA